MPDVFIVKRIAQSCVGSHPFHAASSDDATASAGEATAFAYTGSSSHGSVLSVCTVRSR